MSFVQLGFNLSDRTFIQVLRFKPTPIRKSRSSTAAKTVYFDTLQIPSRLTDNKRNNDK